MTPAKEIDGELWVKAADMQLAIAEAVKAEREACAKVLEAHPSYDFCRCPCECATAIRSRK